MKIKISDLEMAFDGTVEQSAREVADRFGVIVELTGKTAGGGWPTVHIIGTPQQVLKALTSEGGWSCGDEEQDAEIVYYAMKEATEVFG